jgi:hypothetical protein
MVNTSETCLLILRFGSDTDDLFFKVLWSVPAKFCGKFVAMLGRNQRKMGVVFALAGGAML